MRKLIFLFLLFTVWPVFAQNAIPFCSKMTPRVYVRTQIGNPQYISQYSKMDFLKKEGRMMDENTLGLTVVRMDIKSKVLPSLQEQGGKICVSLSDVEVELYYPVFKVYIDKKYMPSSCEYRIIKEHEDYHVAVAQQAITFYKSDVERVVKNTLKNLSPKIVRSQNEIQPVVDQMGETIIN